MFKEIEVDYRQWSGASATELGYGGFEDSTKLHTYTNSDESTHGVLVIDGRKGEGGRTILKSTSLNYRIDPMLVRQETILANKLGARIAVAELPGVSGLPLDAQGNTDFTIDIDQKIESVFQSRKEMSDVRHGKFDLLAKKQLDSLIDILKLSPHDSVEFHGHSLGAMIATTMARVAVNQQAFIPLTIDRIHLDDPANISRLSVYDVAQKINSNRTESKRRNEVYLRENELIGHGDITAFERQSKQADDVDRYIKSKQRKAVLNSAQALTKGIDGIIDDVIIEGLRNGSISNETVISTAHYRDSLISNMDDIKNLSAYATAKGVRSEIIEYSPAGDDPTMLGHHTPTSLGRAASIAINTPR